jgi:hypothetical protein
MLWPAVSSGAVIDQVQDLTSSNLLVGATDQRIAQTFTAGIEGELSQVRLRIGYLPSTGGDASDLVLEVMNPDINGLPAGSVLGSVSLSHTAFPIAGGLFNPTRYTDFDFAGIPLHAGSRYVLSLRVATPAAVCGAGSASCTEPAYRADYFFSGTDPYPGGQLFTGTGAVPRLALFGDLSFQTFMNTPLVAVPETRTWAALLFGFAGLAMTRKLLPAYRNRPRAT